MNCLLIEDDEVSRIQLKGLLEEIGGIDVVGEAYDVESGIDLIGRYPKADLLILDVELPGGTCFDIIEHHKKLPKLLFTTSHEQYALSAFELNALDYIQKPISLDRLRLALDRLDTPPAADHHSLPLLQEDDRILLCCNKHRYFKKVSEIAAVLSDENYTHILCSNGRRFVMKKTMAAWEAQLPNELFMRISRQQLVNTDAMDCFEVKERGGLLWLRGIKEPLEIKAGALKNLQALVKTI